MVLHFWRDLLNNKTYPNNVNQSVKSLTLTPNKAIPRSCKSLIYDHSWCDNDSSVLGQLLFIIKREKSFKNQPLTKTVDVIGKCPICSGLSLVLLLRLSQVVFSSEESGEQATSRSSFSPLSASFPPSVPTGASSGRWGWCFSAVLVVYLRRTHGSSTHSSINFFSRESSPDRKSVV